MHTRNCCHFSLCFSNPMSKHVLSMLYNIQFILYRSFLCCYCGAQDLAAADAANLDFMVDFMDASQASICEDFKELKHLMKETGFRRIAKEYVDEMSTNIRRDLQELQRLFQPRPCQVRVHKQETADGEVKSEAIEGETAEEIAKEEVETEATELDQSQQEYEEQHEETEEVKVETEEVKVEMELGHPNENMDVEAKECEESSEEIQVLKPAPKRKGQKLMSKRRRGRSLLKAAKRSKATRDEKPKRNTKPVKTNPKALQKKKDQEKQQKNDEGKKTKKDRENQKKNDEGKKTKKDQEKLKKKDQEKKRKKEKLVEPLGADDAVLRKKLHSVTLP